MIEKLQALLRGPTREMPPVIWGVRVLPFAHISVPPLAGKVAKELSEKLH